MAFRRFGWYGFGLQLPEGWFPNSFSGGRHDGYVRVQSTGQAFFQIKWAKFRQEPNPGRILTSYRRSLAKSLGKQALSFETKEVPLGTEYRLGGSSHARGILLVSQASRRTFLLEVHGTKGSGRLEQLREIVASFTDSHSGEAEVWAILGLQVRLPAPADLQRNVLQSGRIQLHWKAGKTLLSAGRSSFGNELMHQMSLVDWAKSLSGNGTVTETEQGVELHTRRRTPFGIVDAVTLARFEAGANHLEFVSSMYREDQWRPTWDWLVSCPSSNLRQ